MPVSENARAALSTSSLIRKMFEEGLALKKQHGADKVFDFSLGNPDVEPPPEFKRVLSELAADKTPGVHGYMPNAGLLDARAAIAEKLSAEEGLKLGAENIVMSCGAAGALNVVFKTILNPGDEVIVPSPYFVEYRVYAANYGGILVGVPTKADFGLDVEAIRGALGPKTAAVLINSPNNPTGRLYSKEDIAALAGVLAESAAKDGRPPYLIADEPYRELVYDGKKAAPVLSSYKNTIIVNSWSKSLSLPGERIGFIACSPECDDLGELRGGLIWATRALGFVNAPAIMQRCVARLCGVTVNVEVYARRRAAFRSVLESAGLEYAPPEGAFYFFVKVPRGQNGTNDDAEFSKRLKNELILGVSGGAFGAPGWIRFAYCVKEELILASEGAFKRSLRAWNGL
ncbi:MAG: pyridoxal phosphate-dependent aminotransferase [Spirochaetaceae bacterium]|jgi:aspartate aminotransferase|nr:pyridoxal phosphate-dependent aminotransferase [Spirochaetaceae bacterium]